MKFFYSLLMIFIFCSNPNSAINAQDLTKTILSLTRICGGNIGDNHDNTGGIVPAACQFFPQIRLNDKCGAEVDLRFYFTDLGFENPTTSNVYTFPSTYPAVYARYEYEPGMWVTSGPYTDVRYDGSDLGADGMPHDRYYTEFTLPLGDFIWDDCSNSTFDNQYVTFGLEMVTPDRTASNLDYILYPIHTYSESIFSCHVMYDTHCDCYKKFPGVNGAPCPQFPLEPSYIAKTCLDCTECGHSPGDPSLDGEGSSKSFSLDISPNPFNSNLKLSFENESNEAITCSIYSSIGKLEFLDQNHYEKGVIQLDINTHDLSSGIYYLKVEQGKSQTIKKIFKSN